ncbi:MAG: MFS transporter [Tepidisphaeraceae bacterium]
MHNVSTATFRAGSLVYSRRTLTLLFVWLLWGDFCYQLMENVVPSILPLKFKQLGASNTLVGIILNAIPMGMMMALNPVISVKSDRFRSRWGRRIPFILCTLPMLVGCLILLAYGDAIGPWLHAKLGGRTSLSATSLSLGVIALAMVLFSFFNTFVNSVFWYLFNDVVPERMLARFMSWLRIVTLTSVALYNVFVFRYAETHARTIIVNAALLYLVGFGLMCLNVKEGEYPPPSAVAKRGVGSAIRSYITECHGLAHYRYIFLIGIGWGCVSASNTFMLYFHQSTGLTLERIGYLRGTQNIAVALMVLITGPLADRYHPIRVLIAGVLLQVCLALPLSLVWVVWSPSPDASFAIWLCITLGVIAPAAAMITVLDPPLLMRIFPRQNYGQFCSANAFWRSAATIACGVLAGVYFDLLRQRLGDDLSYRTLPFFQMGAFAIILWALFKLYRSWKRYGGDLAYAAPTVTALGEPTLPASR